MSLVNIIITTATILASGIIIFFGIGYLSYKGNKKKGYYKG